MPTREYERLGLDDEFYEILGLRVPLIRMPVAPGRNIAILVEVAARNQLLRAARPPRRARCSPSGSRTRCGARSNRSAPTRTTRISSREAAGEGRLDEPVRRRGGPAAERRRRAAEQPGRRPAKRPQAGQPFIILTGLSGSGKSQAIRALEDLGYFCVDNLPTTLIPTLAKLSLRAGGDIEKVAIVVDVREGDVPVVVSRRSSGSCARCAA